MGRKLGRGSAPFFGGRELNPHLAQLAWMKAHLHAKCRLDPSSRLATIQLGQKLGGSAPFWGGGAGSPSNTMSLGPRPTSLPCDILIHLATTDVGQKLGALLLWGREAGLPSNTMWPGPRPTCVPSFIFIYPTVWPQYTNVTHRQSGQDRTGDTTV